MRNISLVWLAPGEVISTINQVQGRTRVGIGQKKLLFLVPRCAVEKPLGCAGCLGRVSQDRGQWLNEANPWKRSHMLQQVHHQWNQWWPSDWCELHDNICACTYLWDTPEVPRYFLEMYFSEDAFPGLLLMLVVSCLLFDQRALLLVLSAVCGSGPCSASDNPGAGCTVISAPGWCHSRSRLALQSELELSVLSSPSEFIL